MPNHSPITDQPIQNSRNQTLFLSSVFFYGFSINGFLLLNSLYFLSIGLPKQFIGGMNGVASLTALLLGFCLGILSDRIGSKKAMMIGAFVSGLAGFLMLQTETPWLILVFFVVCYSGFSLYEINRSPLTSLLSHPSQGKRLFSLGSAMYNFAGAVGTILIGFLPSWLRLQLALPPSSAPVYRIALVVSALAILVSAFPLLGLSNFQREYESSKPGFTLLLRQLAKPKFLSVLLLFFIYGLGLMLVMTFIPVFYREQFPLSEGTIGVIVAAAGLSSAAGALISTRIVRAGGGAIKMIAIVWGLDVICMLWMAATGVWWQAATAYCARSFLLNLGYIMLVAFGMEIVPADIRGSYSALVYAATLIGYALGSTISGIILTEYGFSSIIIASGIAITIAGLLCWILLRQHEFSNRSENTLFSE